MNFIIKILTAEGETNPSSKRLITLIAFVLMSIGFIAELFFDKTVNYQTYEIMMYIVLGGLGFTASEKFGKKNSDQIDAEKNTR